jgi:hypothetical protein
MVVSNKDDVEKNPIVVMVSNLELDENKTQEALCKFVEGLEALKPDIIVLIGNFISAKNIDSDSYDSFRSKFEYFGTIIRQSPSCLRDFTQWVIIPSINDPGMMKVLPATKLPEFFI